MFKALGLGIAFAIAALPQTRPAAKVAHVWEKQEIMLKAQNSSLNPYSSVDVWVDLAGPGFNKRAYGFWDGESTFRVRIVAIAPGLWSSIGGSNAGTLTSNTNSMIRMPKKPTDDDWGMRLVLKNVVRLGAGPPPPAGGPAGVRE